MPRCVMHVVHGTMPGAWHIERDGKSLIDTIPASSFYHVLCAVTEAEQVLEG
jgi:mannose-6-phosphate isomerase